MFKFSYSIFDENLFRRGFYRVDIPATLANMRESFEEIHEDFLEMEAGQFDSKGARGGVKQWKDLAPSTLIEKSRLMRMGLAISMDPLIRTGKLRESMIREGAEGNITRINADSMEMGTSIPYAVYHQKGGGNLPKREVIQLTNDDKKRWVNIIQKRIVRIIRGEE